MQLYKDINRLIGSNYQSDYDIDFSLLFGGTICLPEYIIHKIVSKFPCANTFDLLSSYVYLSEDLLDRYKNKLDWYKVCKDVPLSVELLDKFSDKLFWPVVSHYQKLSEEFIDKHSDKVDWNNISIHQKLSESFIERHKDEVYWKAISIFQVLSEDFIDRNSDKVEWISISWSQKLSESFIEKHKDDVDSYRIISYQKLSERFIENHNNLFNYSFAILKYQKLSEDFIRKHFNKLEMSYICIYQKLSEKFIDDYLNELDLKLISSYQKLSNKFIRSHSSILDKIKIQTSWLYISNEEKKQAIINTGLYECYDNYFIAYKAIRLNRYSLLNFQYKYEKGCIYESNCDCTEEENSFGLNVGTEMHAKSYGNIFVKYMIVRCKVYYKDIGRIVHFGQKVRCFKIEILD